jgi:HK97 family phage major capsid protein
MARNTYEPWIPEEWDSDVYMRVRQTSVVESYGSRVDMSSDTMWVPRSAGVDIDITPKGTAYGEDTNLNDTVLLTTSKFTRGIRVAEEDVADINSHLIASKQRDWGTSYAKAIDNACFATTASGAPSTSTPFNSIYYSLTQTNSATNYTANTNITQGGTATPTYDNLNTTLKLHETSDFFDFSTSIVIMHPIFRFLLRSIKDGQSRPIFIDSTDGQNTPPTFFGLPVRYSLGARTSGTVTQNPTAAYLLIFANPGYLKLGVRSGPETQYIPPEYSTTDEGFLKLRARRGFAIGHEKAFAIYVYSGT